MLLLKIHSSRSLFPKSTSPAEGHTVRDCHQCPLAISEALQAATTQMIHHQNRNKHTSNSRQFFDLYVFVLNTNSLTKIFASVTRLILKKWGRGMYTPIQIDGAQNLLRAQGCVCVCGRSFLSAFLLLPFFPLLYLFSPPFFSSFPPFPFSSLVLFFLFWMREEGRIRLDAQLANRNSSDLKSQSATEIATEIASKSGEKEDRNCN